MGGLEGLGVYSYGTVNMCSLSICIECHEFDVIDVSDLTDVHGKPDLIIAE